jgi:hypothetical protein
MADAYLQSAIQVHLQHALIPTSRTVSISIALQDAWFGKELRRGNPGRAGACSYIDQSACFDG